MEFFLGFIIALAISLTGVGAGSMTTPLLILVLGVSPSTAVGTALAFGAIVKIVSIPVYAVRRQVNFRVLGLLMAGGLPGVLIGSVLLDRLKKGPYQGALYGALGGLIAATAVYHLYRVFWPRIQHQVRDRSRLLPWFSLPIGAEVGFSSAGAGALGSLLLLSMTRLSAVEIIGTDLCFGLGVSLVGSAIQISAGNYNGALLVKLVVGGLCGSLAGTLLAGRIPQRPLRVALLIMLTILGCQLAMHGTGVKQPGSPTLRAVR